MRRAVDAEDRAFEAEVFADHLHRLLRDR
jgi:hypothetical protein